MSYVTKSQRKEAGVSSLFRNVPFLTSLEMSLFFSLLWSSGYPSERSPAPRFCAARLGRSGGGHPEERCHLRSTQALQLHSLLVALPPGMILRWLIANRLGWLAACLSGRC